MEKMLRVDNLCIDILYFKNYLVALANVNCIDKELRREIMSIIHSLNHYYKQYQCYSAVQHGKVIKDLNAFREMVCKLHIRKYKNKELIAKYDEICFFLSETKKLYFSSIAI